MKRGFRRSLRALGGDFSPAHWEQDRREALLLLAPIGLSVGLHFAHLPLWASAGFFLLFLWRLGSIISGHWAPTKSIRWAAAIAIGTSVLGQYGTVFGREPGIALLTLLLGLKLLEVDSRRDLFVVVFLCFFLSLTTFFASQSIGTALTVGIVVIGLFCALSAAHGPGGTVKQHLGLIIQVTWQAAPLAVLFFLLFPRISNPLWALPKDTTFSKTGLSDTLDLGDNSELFLSKEVAFRAQFSGGIPAMGTLYWRGPVLGAFDGMVWREQFSEILPASNSTPSSKKFTYILTQEPNNHPWVFGLEHPLGAISTLKDTRITAVRRNRNYQLVAAEALRSRAKFLIESDLHMQIGLNETPLTLQKWLALPAATNPRTTQLAQELRAKASSLRELSHTVLAFLRNNGFRYTLSPPPLAKTNSIDDFLFRTRAGFCNHYASAFTVLLRSAGIPTRIVTGYMGGEQNPLDDYWVVRQSNAHSWTEAWFVDEGWVRIDPTTAAVAPNIAEQNRQEIAGSQPGALYQWKYRIRLNIEALDNLWNQWILSYDTAQQTAFLKRFGLSNQDWGTIASVLAIFLMLFIGTMALLTLHPRRPKHPIELALHLFYDSRLSDMGLKRWPHETPYRHLARIKPQLSEAAFSLAESLLSSYYHLRYGCQTISHEQIRQFRVTAKGFRPHHLSGTKDEISQKISQKPPSPSPSEKGDE